MTETLTVVEILKSRQNFSNYIEEHSDELTAKLLENYPKRTIKIIAPQLTPTADSLMDTVRDLNGIDDAYLFWFIANEKENLTSVARQLNQMFSKNYGIFIVKAYLLNDDKIDFECLLKPELKAKQIKNSETPAKLLQKKYWDFYFEICDELTKPEFQINPKPQHFAYISIGKAGVQIMQTINTADNYIATELLINNKKEIFNELVKNKVEIEKLLGELN